MSALEEIEILEKCEALVLSEVPDMPPKLARSFVCFLYFLGYEGEYVISNEDTLVPYLLNKASESLEELRAVKQLVDAGASPEEVFKTRYGGGSN